jgi:hypothetical protein
MAKPLYQVLNIDLAVPRDSNAIVEVGVKYDAVKIHQLPAGGGMFLKFGPNPAIPLLRVEELRFLDKCEHPFFCDEGLFLTNGAAVGILILIVSLGTSPEVQP